MYRARGKFCRFVFRRLTFYAAFSRARRNGVVNPRFANLVSEARIIKRGRISVQRFTVVGRYECISKTAYAPRARVRTRREPAFRETPTPSRATRKMINYYFQFFFFNFFMLQKVSQEILDYT